MKMKLLLLAILLATGATSSSCTKKSSGGGDDVKGYLISAYLEDFEGVTGTLSSSSISVQSNSDNELSTNDLIALKLTTGDGSFRWINSTSGGEVNPEFEELANKNGEYGTYTGYVYMGSSNSFTSNISNIQIWAVNDYNENYPAGSELYDIVRISYSSFSPFIKNNYEQITPEMNSPANGGTSRFLGSYANNSYSYYCVELPQNGENMMTLPSVLNDGLGTGAYFAALSFIETASTTTPEFEVCVTFEDGREFRGSFSVDLEYEYYFEG